MTSYTFHKQFNPASNEDQITVSGPDGVDTLTRIELSSFTGPGFYNRFDPVNYLNQNPDIAAGGLDPLTHYLGFGASEGRDPNASVHLASVDGLEYIASYPDLIVAFGDHPATGLQHFEQQGYSKAGSRRYSIRRSTWRTMPTCRRLSGPICTRQPNTL